LALSLLAHCSGSESSPSSPPATTAGGSGTAFGGASSGGGPASAGSNSAGRNSPSGGAGGAPAASGSGGVASLTGGSGSGGAINPATGGVVAIGGSTTGGSAQGGSAQGGSAQGGSAQGGSAQGDSARFILGADISSVQEAVDRGARYADTDGVEKSLLEILKAHGFNYIRLRAFVDPSADYGYAQGTGGNCSKSEAYCDTAHTVEFAQQIKALGMGFLLDLHYSDTWADPGKQIIPASFRNATSLSDLAMHVSAYTTEVLNALIDAGARPDMVQVGNEITPGMLIHVPNDDTDCYGNNATENSISGSSSNWDNLATLLEAGTAAVRAVDPTIKVMLHIENTDDLAGARWWVDNAVSRDIDFDVLGLSCYTAFQGSPSVWRATFQALAADYPDLEFAIAEYNPERTQANQIMRDLPNARGLGTFLWEPTQSGSWGDSLFTTTAGILHANPTDFAEYDAMRPSLGL
jgi:arabinogalactan endo-1,4-beta-galactosidase